MIRRYFPGIKRPKTLPSRNRITAVNQKIVALLGFQETSNKIKKLMAQKLAQSIQQVNDPLHMLRDLITYMENKKIAFPSYSTLQDLVGSALTG